MSHSPTCFSLHCADFTVHGFFINSRHTWGPSCRFRNQSSWILWILSRLGLAQDPLATSPTARNQACLRRGRWQTNWGASRQIRQPSNEMREKIQSKDCPFSSWSSCMKVLKCAEQQPNGCFGRAILRILLVLWLWHLLFSCSVIYPPVVL